MNVLERVALLLLVAVAVAVVVALAGWVARRRLRTLQEVSPDTLLRSLAVEPDGRPIVVAFSAPGCAVCRTAQRPALQALQRTSSHDPRVISIDLSQQPAAASTFGVLTVPSTVVLTPRGRVLTANHGFAPADLLLEQVNLAVKN
ncbi:MAG TPA: thioredoxin family protein [Chloroflexota bacterium]|nr:thioredoxin family protein [Chloroflexota bacterium]